ncbi:MAG TPA: nitroreductase family protein [Baekduia sp.]|nr:nitroreductase family protein [Baekduia sp.]
MSLERDDPQHKPLTELLEQRWSPRAFDPGFELTHADMRLLFEAARWSPSAGNSQPWSFIYGLRGDDTHAAIFELLADGNKRWAGRPSAIIMTVRQLEEGPDHELFGADHTQYDLGQAAAHLTVQAQSTGLHVHQFSGFDRPGIAERFGVPDHWEVTSGIAVGRIAAPEVLGEDWQIEREREPRTRRPIEEFVFSGRWGQSAF